MVIDDGSKDTPPVDDELDIPSDHSNVVPSTTAADDIHAHPIDSIPQGLAASPNQFIDSGHTHHILMASGTKFLLRVADGLRHYTSHYWQC